MPIIKFKCKGCNQKTEHIKLTTQGVKKKYCENCLRLKNIERTKMRYRRKKREHRRITA